MSESTTSRSPSPAGPSSPTAYALAPPPPEAIQVDDYIAAEEARRRFYSRGFFHNVSLPHFRKRRAKARRREASLASSSVVNVDVFASTPEIPNLVDISEGAELDEDYDKDVYRWAILYENQRGYVYVYPRSCLSVAHRHAVPWSSPPHTTPRSRFCLWIHHHSRYQPLSVHHARTNQLCLWRTIRFQTGRGNGFHARG